MPKMQQLADKYSDSSDGSCFSQYIWFCAHAKSILNNLKSTFTYRNETFDLRIGEKYFHSFGEQSYNNVASKTNYAGID